MATGNQTTSRRRAGLLERFLPRLHVSLYRLTGGRIGGHMFNNPVLLLTTIGRKTGKQRITPLTYISDGENMVVIASNGGAPTHPAWYRNLQAHPVTDVQVRGRKLRVRAEDAPPEDVDRLWAKAISKYSGYAEYRAKAGREVPVVILRPIEK